MDDGTKKTCCGVTCLVVLLVVVGWTLESFSNSCSGSITCEADQKNQLQLASSGLLASAAVLTLLCCIFLLYKHRGDLMSGGFFFGSSDHSFGSRDYSFD
jgi:hypothetical protein